MSQETKLPDFDQFSRWLASRPSPQGIDSARFEPLRAAARAARDEYAATRQELPHGEGAPGSFEVLQLLAAADGAESLPSEITTSRGFRLTLADEEIGSTEATSIGVLVTCPPDLIDAAVGKSVYLWSGAQRFEIGEFDAEGKAVGELPSGIEIKASDFALGKVRLETP
jgi:hypothetical protein